MEDELVLNIKIDGTQSAKTIKELTARNRELAKALRDAPREGTEEFKKLNVEIKSAKEEFAKNRQEIQKFNRDLRETKVAGDSLKGLSRQLRKLEGEYKSLGKEAREATGGKLLQRRILTTRNNLKRLEKQLGDNRRNVGNYGKAWQKAGAKIAGVGRATGAALAVEFAIQGLQALDETIQKFEDLRLSINQFSGASGEALDQFTSDIEGLAKTFDGEADEIASAANKLSSNLGISFEESIALIEKGFLAGADANGDFISSLDELSEEAGKAGVSAEELVIAIQQGAKNGADANIDLVKSYKGVDATLDDVVDASSDFTKQQQAQLAANKSLAATQNELSKNLASSSANIKILGTNVANFALKAFNDLIETLSPVVEAFGGLFDALGNIFEAFGLAEEGSSGFQGAINVLLSPLKLFANTLTFLVNIFTSMTDSVANFVRESPTLQKVIGGIGKAFTGLKNTINAIPAVFTGIVAAAKQAGTNIANFFKGIAIDAQILFQQIQQLNPFGPAQEQIDETIAGLRKQREDLAKESIGIFDAFGQAFNTALEQQAELAEELPVAVEDAATEVEKTLEKAFTDGTKKGTSNAKKSIKELEEETVDGSLKSMREAISEIKTEFENVATGTDEFKAKLQELITAEEALAEAERKIKEARESDAERTARIEKEKQAIADKNAEELQSARDLVNQVTDESLKLKLIALSEERNAALQSDELTAEDRLRINQEFNRKSLEATIQAEKERVAIAKAGSEEELAARQALLDAELSLLEQKLDEEERLSEERIKNKEEEAETLADIEKEIANAAFSAAKTAADTAFSIGISKANDKKNAELKLVKEEFAEKLKLAEGNTDAQEALRKQQAQKEAEIAKKAAETNRALSITKAVVAGALGAVQTIANLGFPAAIPGLIAVAAATAANIATIAAAKFKRGGIAKKKKMEDGGIAPGKLHSDGGTPAVIGGQEVVEIEVGEAIMNRRSTSRFMQTLSDINQAEGGIRFQGTKPLTSKRLRHLSAFQMMSSQMPTMAKRGLSPRFSPSVRRRLQTGGVSSVQSQQAQFTNSVEFKGKVLSEQDVEMIAKATGLAVKQGLEQANLFGQFKRQAEREIGQESRSQV